MRVYHEIRKNEDGFTMIEMMVVIIIVGILVGSFASGFMIYLDQARTKQTNERLEKIKEAVNLYLELNEKLPCTASLTAEIDSAGFGKEVDATDCRNANFDGTFRDDAFNVRIGAVPVRSLNIPDEYSFDGWGNRFFYVVQETLATEGEYNGVGRIKVVDSHSPPNQITSSAHFIIFSAGADGVGAYNRSGIRVAACNGNAQDIENCDMDVRFRSTLLFSETNTNRHFDDIIYYQTRTKLGQVVPSGAVMAFNLDSCPDGWSGYNPARGRFIIGMTSGAFTFNQNYNYNSRHWSSGDRTYTRGQQGGYANWLQGEDEIALHDHNLNMRKRNVATEGSGRILMEYLATGNMRTDDTGGLTAMENIPPYVALLYCQKD